MQSFPENIFYPLICTRKCSYQGVKNFSFFEKFCIPTKCDFQFEKKANLVNLFHAIGLFLYPLKTLENLWLFLGGIERGQVHEIGSRCIQDSHKHLTRRTLQQLSTAKITLSWVFAEVPDTPLPVFSSNGTTSWLYYSARLKAEASSILSFPYVPSREIQ